jgi:hypothetical protein
MFPSSRSVCTENRSVRMRGCGRMASPPSAAIPAAVRPRGGAGHAAPAWPRYRRCDRRGPASCDQPRPPHPRNTGRGGGVEQCRPRFDELCRARRHRAEAAGRSTVRARQHGGRRQLRQRQARLEKKPGTRTTRASEATERCTSGGGASAPMSQNIRAVSTRTAYYVRDVPA